MALLGIISFPMVLTRRIFVISSNEVNNLLHLILLTLYRGVVAPFAKWQRINKVLHNSILLYIIHFLWQLTTGVVCNISRHEKLLFMNTFVLELLKWTRIPTSLQVLGLYIPYSPRFAIICKYGVSVNIFIWVPSAKNFICAP